MRSNLMLLAGSILVAVVGNPVLGIVAAAGGVVLLRIGRLRRQRTTEDAYDRAIPLLLDGVSRSVRSGAGILAAMDEAAQEVGGELGEEIGALVREVRMGSSFEESMRAWRRKHPTRSVALTIAALGVVIETGSSTARAVDSIAATVRQLQNASATARMYATQARMSALVLTVLPIGICIMTCATSAPARRFVLHSELGTIVLIVGLTLDALGAWWMSKLVQRALR